MPPITGPGDCTATDVVELDAVLLPDHRVVFSPAATLRCPMAETVARWVRDDVAPTMATFGTVLRGVETLDSFDCRRRNACARFSTVLGNGADAYHDSHVHLDLIERSNNYRICQWDVLDVPETAALAAKKVAAARSIPAVVPLPRPRPAVNTDRPRHRFARLGEGARGHLFNLFVPLVKSVH